MALTETQVFIQNFWPNMAGTVAGGILLSAIFFLLKEWVFSITKLTGIWECKLSCNDTAYNPHQGMKLWYRVTLVQSGNEINGYGERDREDSSTGARRYEGSSRTPVDITGRIEKNIFRPDRISLVWAENSKSRRSSTVFHLHISGSKNHGNLWGTYSSTISESNGHSCWKRNA